jgi:hypothetical protein
MGLFLGRVVRSGRPILSELPLLVYVLSVGWRMSRIMVLVWFVSVLVWPSASCRLCVRVASARNHVHWWFNSNNQLTTGTEKLSRRNQLLSHPKRRIAGLTCEV